MLWLITFAAVAQQAGLSPEQMRMLQSLSPEQQASLLQAVQSGSLPGTGTATSPGAQLPQLPGMLAGEMAPSAEQYQALQAQLDELLEVPRIEGEDTLVVKAWLREDVDPGLLGEFLADVNRSRFLGSRTLRTDKKGILEIPGIASVPLAGLDSEQVAIRLMSEPLLEALEIEVTILPVARTGTDALKPFGYELFEADVRPEGGLSGMPMPFGTGAPAFTPVPRDYVIGPGDLLKVQFYGNENYEVILVVNEDGSVNFPRIGPRPVAGLTYGELKDDVEQRVSDQLIGTQAAVSVAELRAIQVFVVGDVKRPGAYALSGLSRITNALFASGGITEIGSLRRIELKRGGQLAGRLDLYDLLLRGDTSDDVQLEPNDVVFIPPASNMVGIDGEVKRPALYELRGERTVADLIALAGGLLPSADAATAQLERVLADARRRIETVNVRQPSGLAMVLADGDLLRVPPVPSQLDDAIFLTGHVTRPGSYEWSPGMRLTTLIPSDAYLKPRADLRYVVIRREVGRDRQVTVVSADLESALAAPGSDADLVLNNRDRVTIFELGIARSAAIQGILKELDAQATSERPFRAVKISGQVRAPGTYPLEEGMRISDLLRAGGGLKAGAYPSDAELTRYIVGSGGARRTELITLDLEALRRGDDAADLYLTPYDYLNIREIPEWEEQFEVELAGEVVFPGKYPVTRGETLGQVLARAGGLTDMAFPEGTVFTRATLQEREAQQLETLATRLEADLTSLALQASAAGGGGGAQRALGIGQSLLEQLRTATPTGRLVIDLRRVLSSPGDSESDIVLRNGDKVMIPSLMQEIMVLGEVQYSTSHLYQHGLNRDRYIELSGGMTPNADKKRAYVVRANGAVVAKSGSRWFPGGGSAINPGDTIVVPLDTDRLPQLAQWTSITQIIYNLAIAVAAVNSF